MNQMKLPIKIQYLLFNLISLSLIFLNFFGLKVSMMGWLGDTFHITGVEWLQIMIHPQADFIAALGIQDVDLVNQVFGASNVLGTILFLLPFIMMFLNLILHGFVFFKDARSSLCPVFSGISVFLTILELIISSILLNNALDAVTAEVMEVSVSPAIGCILFLVISFVLLLEDLLIVPQIVEVAPQASYREIALEEEKEALVKQKTVTPVVENQGRLVCVRGEYQGAEIMLQVGERITIGRDQESCQLVISDPRISRKHCIIVYQADGKYMLTNVSKNGVKLHDGRDVPYNMPISLSAGIAFRLNEHNVFRVG